MNNETNNKVLFNYIKKTQDNPSMIMRFILAGFVFSLIFIVINLFIPSRELTLVYAIKVSLACIVGGVFWAGSFYWIYMGTKKD